MLPKVISENDQLEDTEVRDSKWSDKKNYETIILIHNVASGMNNL